MTTVKNIVAHSCCLMEVLHEGGSRPRVGQAAPSGLVLVNGRGLPKLRQAPIQLNTAVYFSFEVRSRLEPQRVVERSGGVAVTGTAFAVVSIVSSKYRACHAIQGI